MTPLRQRMLQDMQMRNLSPHTHEAYIRAVARLATFYKLAPDRLDLEQVRAFLVHLVGQQVSFSLFNQVRCALVFFYRVTLGRDWNFDRISCQKQPKRLPVVLSQAEMAQFFAAIGRLKYRALLGQRQGSGAGTAAQPQAPQPSSQVEAKTRCPVCRQGHMVIIGQLGPVRCGESEKAETGVAATDTS